MTKTKTNKYKSTILIFVALLLGICIGYFIGFKNVAKTDSLNLTPKSLDGNAENPQDEYFNNPQIIAKLFYQDYIQFMTAQQINGVEGDQTKSYLSNSIFVNDKLNNLNQDEVVCSEDLPYGITVDDNPSISHGGSDINAKLLFPNNEMKEVKLLLVYDESDLRWKINSIDCL